VRVTVVTGGSRGDVQPLVALALGMRRAGHEVLLSATRDAEALVRGHGIGFRGSSYSIRDQMTSAAGRRWVAGSQGRPLREMKALTALTREWAPTVARDLLGLAGSADLFVSGAMTVDAVATLAERDGARHACALLTPFHPTRDGVVAVPPLLPGRVHPLNRAAGRLTLWTVAGPFGLVGQALRQQLGLPPGGRRNFIEAMLHTPSVLGASRVLVPPPEDWPNTEVTGDWPLPIEPGWSPPADLVQFLDGAPPPVYIGFGSMSMSEQTGSGPAPAVEAMLDAVRRTGRRAVLSHSGGALPLGVLTGRPEIFVVGDMPHAWLFPRMSAVVHHGGAGTTHATLRAGVPSAAVPHVADQTYWGLRLHALGVGPAPLPRHRLDGRSLAGVISELTGSVQFATRASELAVEVSAEHGVEAAVRALGLADADRARS